MEHVLREQHRGRFYEMMEEILSTKREDNNSYINRERYRTLIEEVKEAKRLRSKKGKHYRRLRRFNVLNFGEEEKLVVPVSPGHTEVVYFVQYEDLFDILHAAHIAIGHGGRTRMLKELSPEQESSAETQETQGDVNRRKPDLLIDLSGRTTPPRLSHSLAHGAESQPIKEEPEDLMQEMYSYLDCGKHFGPKQSLLDHETPHPFQCLECHKSFGWEDAHQPEGHPPATCPECIQRLRKKRSSLAQVVDAQPFACATCGATFSQWSMQLRHQKCHGPHSHSCGECGAGAGSAQELQRHRRAHAVVGRAHACLNCPCSFLSSSELAAHRRTHTSSWPFTCSWCQSTFASRKVLSEHQERHVAAARKALPNVKLSFSFNWREFLAEQMKHCLHSGCSPQQALAELLQKNSELWPYPCTECGTHFFNQWALANHRCAPLPKPPAQATTGGGSVLWQGAGPDLPPAAFQCPSCGLGFPQEESLAEHLPRHSGEGRPFQCPHCKNSYLCKEALAGHVQSHFTWRPGHCYICDRDFAQPEQLVEHLGTHVVEHPFKCGRCRKSFLSPFLLGKHFQQEHAALG